MVTVSALCFGSLSVFSRHLTAAGMSVPMMLALRFAGGAFVMWSLAVARREVRLVTLREWAMFATLGLLYVVEAWTYFESAQRIPVALTALLLYLYPTIVSIISWLRGDALGRAGAIALILSTGGVALAVGAGTGDVQPLGVILGAATAIIYSVYVLVGARARGVPASLGSAWLMTIAALAFGLVSYATGRWEPLLAVSEWGDVAGLVVFGTAVPIPLLLAGLTRVGPARSSIISSLEPLSAAACGALFLGEPLGVPQLAGVALVIAALVLLARRDLTSSRDP
jgi:drug/metabolite transporter (DMT)-like permease